jgi:hypothetical protein
MGVWGIFLVILIVGNSFILLEEETLVMIASIFWLDAAGSLIKGALTSEIENRGALIEEKFRWYLETKKRLLELLIKKHEYRKSVSGEIKEVYLGYIDWIVGSVVKNYLNQVVVGLRYERRMDLLLVMSRYWVAYGLVGEMEEVLGAIEEVESK